MSGDSSLTLLIRTSTRGTSMNTYGEFLLRNNTLYTQNTIGSEEIVFPIVRINSAGIVTVRMRGTTTQGDTVGIAVERV